VDTHQSSDASVHASDVHVVFAFWKRDVMCH
jgi:hypothetical protein